VIDSREEQEWKAIDWMGLVSSLQTLSWSANATRLLRIFDNRTTDYRRQALPEPADWSLLDWSNCRWKCQIRWQRTLAADRSSFAK
jgi:hypothetical protein